MRRRTHTATATGGCVSAGGCAQWSQPRAGANAHTPTPTRTAKRKAGASCEGKCHHLPVGLLRELVEELQRRAADRVVRGRAELPERERTGCRKRQVGERIVQEHMRRQPAGRLHLVPQDRPATLRAAAGRCVSVKRGAVATCCCCPPEELARWRRAAARVCATAAANQPAQLSPAHSRAQQKDASHHEAHRLRHRADGEHRALAWPCGS